MDVIIHTQVELFFSEAIMTHYIIMQGDHLSADLPVIRNKLTAPSYNTYIKMYRKHSTMPKTCRCNNVKNRH